MVPIVLDRGTFAGSAHYQALYIRLNTRPDHSESQKWDRLCTSRDTDHSERRFKILSMYFQ